MSTPTKDRLTWILSQLDNLNNGGNIRYDGNTTFQGARMELVDIIDTYVDHSADLAPVILQAMTPDQLQIAVAGLVASSGGIVSAVGDMFSAQLAHADAGQVEVLGAIAGSRADVLAAVAPAPAPAPAAEPQPA